MAQGALCFRPGRSTPDVDIGGTIDLRELILLPLRAKAATDDLDATSIEAAGLSMDVAYHARDAYVDYLAAHQMVDLEKSIVDAFDASAELAKTLHAAGNSTALSELTERAAYEDARLAYAQAQADDVAARSRLNLVMGLSGEEGSAWQPATRLSDPPDEELGITDVEARAVGASLDLAELKARYAAADGRVDLAGVAGAIPSLQAGAIAELDPEGWGVGPQVGLGVPLFYQGEGEAASARAERKVAEATSASTAAQVRWLARTLAVDLTTSRERAVRYKTTLMPLRQQIVDETLSQYNAMSVSAFVLFEAKRAEIESARSYVTALSTYWKTRGELEMLLAGRMPDEALTGMNLSWQALRAKEMPR